MSIKESIILSFIVFALSSLSFAVNTQNAVSLREKLVNELKRDQKTFCQGGALSVKGIRLRSGEYCRTEIGAALAQAVCTGYKGGLLERSYENSDCFRHASSIANNVGEANRIIEESINTAIVKNIRVQEQEICLLLKEVMGMPIANMCTRTLSGK